ncbi:hypothetical protein EJD96_14015 [Herbaspirillum seropedicae]|uniref:hypothetical protein n=1 Tax=Herbaspirillum seropedicae TaxID=964 RepID=UPI001123BD31|nr:hypothetical protein [Herbaspirillum seropedicae]QDD65198.1 hypothetical protein EJD96_14015 [Herbaspirillum seropedicae]
MWIIATELSEKQQRQINFENIDDQERLLTTLYGRSVKGRDRATRYAIQLDQTKEGAEEDLPSLIEMLPGPANADPLQSLLAQEEWTNDLVALDEAFAASFSQAVAYAITLEKFQSIESLGAFLALTKATLTQRISRATYSVRIQNSLFDGIERISRSFMPKAGRPLIINTFAETVSGQLSLPL